MEAVTDVRVFARGADGSETDITEGVQVLYDLVTSSMNWGSGFWTAEDARPVALLARTCGFQGAEKAERYLRAKEHDAQQQEFISRREAEINTTGQGWVRTVQWDKPGSGGEPVEHDHVFSTAGRCMWPGCNELGEMDPQ